MIQIISSFMFGVYVGTNYNCKPYIDKITLYIKENIPKQK